VTKDATTLLIERIKSQLSEAGVSTPAAGVGIAGQADGLLSNLANWAQLLGLPGGAAGQAIGDVEIGEVVNNVTATVTTAAGQSTALVTFASAETIGDAAGSFIGAAIVLVVAAILAALTGSSDSESSESEQLQALSQEISELEEVDLQVYWDGKLSTIMNFWGPLGTDLDNIASEGIGSNTAPVIKNPDVQSNVSHFHDDALTFVRNFIPSQTPGADHFWLRPGVYDEIFSAQDVYYPLGSIPKTETGGASSVVGWYGAWPQGQPAYPPGGFTNPPLPPTSDPRTMLPFLLLGLNSLLTIQGLIHYINNSELAFSAFVKDFQADLQAYASFLLSLYTLAVTGSVTGDVLKGGIVKSDIPEPGDIMPFLCMIAVNQYSGSWPDIATWLGPDTAWVIPYPATAGMPWNGVYGAVDAHPNYGIHNPPPPVAVPSASASYIVDLINYDNLGPELNPVYDPNAPSAAESFVNWLQTWTIPWVTMRVILGTMARWKALYLFNSYDKVWSAIQNLRVLSGQSVLPTPTLAQDGTLANGNWSARELIARIAINPVVLPLAAPKGSLLFLVSTLDVIAKGNWAGPQGGQTNPTNWSVPSRPLGFRERLAAAAV
jgi:hypothetical protein